MVRVKPSTDAAQHPSRSHSRPRRTSELVIELTALLGLLGLAAAVYMTAGETGLVAVTGTVVTLYTLWRRGQR